ncbi:MAG: histidine kinase [Propionicimonas sp.]
MTVDPSQLQSIDLPRQPGAIRRLMREHPRWVDGSIAGLYLLGTAGLAVVDVTITREMAAETGNADLSYLEFPGILLLLAMVAVTVVALLYRRRYPLWGLVAVLAATSFVNYVPLGVAGVAVWVLLYSVPAYRSVREGWIGYGLSVLASLLALAFTRQAVDATLTGPEDLVIGPDDMLVTVIITGLLMIIPVMIGINAGNRRRYTEAIIDRAHQLARERDQLARLAVAEERSRIAREMHDIVAHSVSVMVMLSEGAARAAEIEPAEAAKAMEQSAETGRAALAEMRRLIGVLRDPDPTAAELAPTPGLDALPELIEGFRAAGLTVELTFHGTPGQPGDQGRELAIFRTVQEALTNTLRHAGPGAVASVRIDERPDATVVRITDDGGIPGQAARMAGVGSGQGLAGLAERVRVFGGELRHGPIAPRGWQVTATLPVAAAMTEATA